MGTTYRNARGAKLVRFSYHEEAESEKRYFLAERKPRACERASDRWISRQIRGTYWAWLQIGSRGKGRLLLIFYVHRFHNVTNSAHVYVAATKKRKALFPRAAKTSSMRSIDENRDRYMGHIELDYILDCEGRGVYFSCFVFTVFTMWKLLRVLLFRGHQEAESVVSSRSENIEHASKRSINEHREANIVVVIFERDCKVMHDRLYELWRESVLLYGVAGA